MEGPGLVPQVTSTSPSTSLNTVLTQDSFYLILLDRGSITKCEVMETQNSCLQGCMGLKAIKEML